MPPKRKANGRGYAKDRKAPRLIKGQTSLPEEVEKAQVEDTKSNQRKSSKHMSDLRLEMPIRSFNCPCVVNMAAYLI